MRITDLLSMSSGTALLPVVDAIAKATILFATAGLLSVVLRRGSAAARHLMWTLALLSALVLPVLSIALPKWQLGIVTVPGSEIASVRLKADATDVFAAAPRTR